MTEDIKKVFQSRNIAESSKTTYASIIRNLMSNMGIDKLSDLLKSRNVLKYLSTKSPSSRKTILSAVITLLTCLGYYDHNAVKKYKQLVKRDNTAVNTDEIKQHKSEKEKLTSKSWDELNNTYDELYDREKHFLKKSGVSKTPMKDLQSIQDLVIATLYIKQKPRRLMDYTELKIKNIDKDTDNYILKNNFVFNKYKTDKKYSMQTVKIEPETKKILDKWIKLIPDDCEYLLFDANGNKLNSVKLNQRLRKIFGLSANMIRSAFLTDMYKDAPSLQNAQQTAEDMGHSVNTAIKNYVKID